MIVGPIGMVGTAVLGAALLWSVRLVYGTRYSTADDVVRLVLTIGGWTLVHIGLLSIAVQIFFVAPGPSSVFSNWLASMVLGALLSLPPFLVVMGMWVARYRDLEWTSLMWLLAAAAKRGIPLSRVVRCFALERCDEVGLRAARLADLLEEGVALPDALDVSKTHLPLAGRLAARYGTETGDLGDSIAGLSHPIDEVGTLVRKAFEKCFYLLVVTVLLIAILTFCNFRMIPMFSRLFIEFEIQLPKLTALLLEAGDLFLQMGLFVSAFLLLCGGIMLIGWLHYLGWLPSDLPLANYFTKRYDGALIMRALAVGVRQQRPLDRVVWMLARLYPKRSVRDRLRKAGERINKRAGLV